MPATLASGQDVRRIKVQDVPQLTVERSGPSRTRNVQGPVVGDELLKYRQRALWGSLDARPRRTRPGGVHEARHAPDMLREVCEACRGVSTATQAPGTVRRAVGREGGRRTSLTACQRSRSRPVGRTRSWVVSILAHGLSAFSLTPCRRTSFMLCRRTSFTSCGSY